MSRGNPFGGHPTIAVEKFADVRVPNPVKGHTRVVNNQWSTSIDSETGEPATHRDPRADRPEPTGADDDD